MADINMLDITTSDDIANSDQAADQTSTDIPIEKQPANTNFEGHDQIRKLSSHVTAMQSHFEHKEARLNAEVEKLSKENLEVLKESLDVFKTNAKLAKEKKELQEKLEKAETGKPSWDDVFERVKAQVLTLKEDAGRIAKAVAEEKMEAERIISELMAGREKEVVEALRAENIALKEDVVVVNTEKLEAEKEKDEEVILLKAEIVDLKEDVVAVTTEKLEAIAAKEKTEQEKDEEVGILKAGIIALQDEAAAAIAEKQEAMMETAAIKEKAKKEKDEEVENLKAEVLALQEEAAAAITGKEDAEMELAAIKEEKSDEIERLRSEILALQQEAASATTAKEEAEKTAAAAATEKQEDAEKINSLENELSALKERSDAKAATAEILEAKQAAEVAGLQAEIANTKKAASQKLAAQEKEAEEKLAMLQTEIDIAKHAAMDLRKVAVTEIWAEQNVAEDQIERLEEEITKWKAAVERLGGEHNVDLAYQDFMQKETEENERGRAILREIKDKENSGEPLINQVFTLKEELREMRVEKKARREQQVEAVEWYQKKLVTTRNGRDGWLKQAVSSSVERDFAVQECTKWKEVAQEAGQVEGAGRKRGREEEDDGRGAEHKKRARVEE